MNLIVYFWCSSDSLWFLIDLITSRSRFWWGQTVAGISTHGVWLGHGVKSLFFWSSARTDPSVLVRLWHSYKSLFGVFYFIKVPLMCITEEQSHCNKNKFMFYKKKDSSEPILLSFSFVSFPPKHVYNSYKRVQYNTHLNTDLCKQLWTPAPNTDGNQKKPYGVFPPLWYIMYYVVMKKKREFMPQSL